MGSSKQQGPAQATIQQMKQLEARSLHPSATSSTTPLVPSETAVHHNCPIFSSSAITSYGISVYSVRQCTPRAMSEGSKLSIVPISTLIRVSSLPNTVLQSFRAYGDLCMGRRLHFPCVSMFCLLSRAYFCFCFVIVLRVFHLLQSRLMDPLSHCAYGKTCEALRARGISQGLPSHHFINVSFAHHARCAS